MDNNNEAKGDVLFGVGAFLALFAIIVVLKFL